jgi:MerR family Zn(II)-responsive transcriptional regulator of zntA
MISNRAAAPQCPAQEEGSAGAAAPPAVVRREGRAAPAPRKRAREQDPPEPAAPSRRLTLKDMMQGASTTARAVRFYESQKLIAAAERSRGGHRLFNEAELSKLRLVLDLRTCGFSIEEIREILRVKSRFSDVRDSAHEIQRILTEHVEELRRKIQVIERLGREFHTTIDVLDRCARCTDPRGPKACQSCDLPAAISVPESFSHIWAVPRSKPGSGSSGPPTM